MEEQRTKNYLVSEDLDFGPGPANWLLWKVFSVTLGKLLYFSDLSLNISKMPSKGGGTDQMKTYLKNTL